MRQMKKILVIDDDPEFVDAISNLLDATGYEVVSASNGKDGFEAAKTQEPDIILLDIMMATKYEGFHVARNMHDDERVKDIPVIIVTGVKEDLNVPFSFEQDEIWRSVKAILEKPATVVLEKPIKPDVLLNTLSKHIRK